MVPVSFGDSVCKWGIGSLCSFTLFFLSLPVSPSHPFLLCLSRLSDKHCLLAINPRGSPDRRPNKALYFLPVWWVCQGPRGSEITLGGGGGGGGRRRRGGDAISSMLHTNTGAHRHTHKQTVGISTWTNCTRSEWFICWVAKTLKTARHLVKISAPRLRKNIFSSRPFFFYTQASTDKHSQENIHKTQTLTKRQRKHQLSPVLSAENQAGFLIQLDKTQGSGKTHAYHAPQNMLLSCLFRCRTGSFF